MEAYKSIKSRNNRESVSKRILEHLDEDFIVIMDQLI